MTGREKFNRFNNKFLSKILVQLKRCPKDFGIGQAHVLDKQCSSKGLISYETCSLCFEKALESEVEE